MDLQKAIHYAQLVQAAYTISSDDLTERAGLVIKPEFDTFKRGYTIVATVYGDDLATNFSVTSAFAAAKVSYGFLLQDNAGNVVIALRGTEGILEWMHDGVFTQSPCPFLPDAGYTEDGFTTIYESLHTNLGAEMRLRDSLVSLRFPRAINSVTVCGHSLGGALVTLLGLDIGANTKFQPAVYSYASPRTGDNTFARVFNTRISESYRVANILDIVPKLPLEHPMSGLPEYRHVKGLYTLNNDTFPPKVLPTVRCEHILSSYLHFLSLDAGSTAGQFALEPTCTFDPLNLSKLFSDLDPCLALMTAD
jgi:hypothetical protein